MFAQIFLIKRVVKLRNKNVKRTTIWNGVSSTTSIRQIVLENLATTTKLSKQVLLRGHDGMHMMPAGGVFDHLRFIPTICVLFICKMSGTWSLGQIDPMRVQRRHLAAYALTSKKDRTARLLH